ncbi:MAG: AraC family transcriptional regulator [Chloroflexota bacterium]
MSALPYTLYLSGENVWSYFEQAQEQLGVNYRQLPNERVLPLPEWFGKGYVRSVSLRNQLNIFILDIIPRQTVAIDCRTLQYSPMFELHFNVTGTSNSKNCLTNDTYQIISGEGVCYYANINDADMHMQGRFPVGQRFTIVEITSDTSVLTDLQVSLDMLFPAQTHRFDKPIIYQNSYGITPAMYTALQQILNCSYTELPRQLYLESKALELLSLYVNEAATRDASQPSQLREDDIERIYTAKHILTQRMDNPPSLVELARQVGINDYKLKVGFREVFGTTVYKYLHTHRMEQARDLLLKRTHSVLEVAYAVGYANPSQFSAAFKKTYGTTPSSYLSKRMV